MRLILFLLVLAAVSFADDLTVVRFMNVSTGTSCPGDWLYMNATDSQGMPVPDVELRLVLYDPYQGLRALEHTDQNGLASVQLTRAGQYRLYIYTNDSYNHDQYVVFDYPAMCPPPPPKDMDVSVSVDCNDSIVSISAASGGAPLSGVFISAQDWSSMTGDSGQVTMPLQEGDIFLNATKQGYASQAFYYTVSCGPPPQCTDSSQCADDQACRAQECVDLNGTCGYASNHAWVSYACCSDSDCGNLSMCVSNSCVPKEMPPFIHAGNNTAPQPPSSNNSAISGGNTPSNKPTPCLGALLFFFGLLILSKGLER